MSQTHTQSLLNDTKTCRRIELALNKSKDLDQTANMNLAAREFNYQNCLGEFWNPERFSLMWGTHLWDQSSPWQRTVLNQLYWIAYYSQIISAEIATIFFNQTSAVSLYGIEDFRVVCDTLDLESAQERAHIHAFKKVSEDVEYRLFGNRVFTYPMRTPFVKTMLYSDLNAIQEKIRMWQLRAYTAIAPSRAFLGCQYFTVRGLRTLNGKIVQHQLSRHYSQHPAPEQSPIPSKISYYHFMDESFHFNTSCVISHDVIHSVPPPTKFESRIVDMSLWGCQRDHFNFSTAINGIFWYDPALFPQVYGILRSPVFAMDHREALDCMRKTFCEESEGARASAETHAEAVESYKAYLADFKHVTGRNKEMKLMAQNNLQRHLRINGIEFEKFARRQKDEVRFQPNEFPITRDFDSPTPGAPTKEFTL